MVDVGGGVGSAILQLIRAHRHLRYVIQERPKVIPCGVKVRLDVDKKCQFINLNAQFWEHEDPEALKSGRVEFIGKASTVISSLSQSTNVYAAHDFFEPQPIKDASVFFLRFIIHEWPNAYAKKILKQLRAAAQPSTKLVICDFLVPYTTSSNSNFSEIPGSEVPPAPYPLLPNLGTVSNQPVMMDLQVCL